MTNTNTHKTNRRLGRRTLVVMALGVAALMAVPASGFAATSFGAKLNSTIQPSNSLPAHKCDSGPAQQCTRVSMDAYNNAGHEKAPKDGVISKVKLIAGGEGHFRLQIAKAKPGPETAKIVRQGPRIDYEGQDPMFDEPYNVESFNVHVPVHKGEYLAIKAKRTSMLRCSSGGPNQLLFQPPLQVGGPFQPATHTDGCWLLLQAVYS
jgi:hypothetical protein